MNYSADSRLLDRSAVTKQLQPGILYNSSMSHYGPSKMTDSAIYQWVPLAMCSCEGVLSLFMQYRIGIYGWRKRCLYAMLLLLMVLIVANISLTFWIMSVLGFSWEGLGGLRISNDKLQVTGHAEFLNPVYLQKLSSSKDSPLFIESSRGVRLTSHDESGNVSSRLVIDDRTVKVVCDQFEVTNRDGKPVFSASEEEVAIRVENLRIISEGGSVFDGSIQASVIRPEPDAPLLLESPTRGMEVNVAQDIEILSRAGDIKAEALHNIILESKTGEMSLSSSKLYIDRLARGSERGHMQYQVCLCENGRLFLAHNGVDCRATEEICGFR